MGSPESFLKKLVAASRALASDEGGQGTVEYVLILSAAVIGAATLARALMNGLNSGVLTLGATLEKDLKTGRAPANVWQN